MIISIPEYFIMKYIVEYPSYQNLKKKFRSQIRWCGHGLDWSQIKQLFFKRGKCKNVLLVSLKTSLILRPECEEKEKYKLFWEKIKFHSSIFLSIEKIYFCPSFFNGSTTKGRIP